MDNQILLVNKPKGISSAKAVDIIKRKLRVKAGHAGTLDPLATGLLLVLTGEKTKEFSSFAKLEKTYEVTGILGMSTNTYDLEGKVLERNDNRVSRKDLERVLDEFQGEIMQTPPPFSAKKVQGMSAYKLARKGMKVDLAPQKVNVYSLELKEFACPSFTLACRVSSGFYVRSLVHDIGEKLGVGAAMAELCRTHIGPYALRDAQDLESFT